MSQFQFGNFENRGGGLYFSRMSQFQLFDSVFCNITFINKNAKRPIEAHIAPIFKEFKDLKQIERIWKLGLCASPYTLFTDH